MNGTPKFEKGGKTMEEYEAQEQKPVNVKELTKGAISLYLRQAAGEEVDPEEIARLREDAHSFPDEREFKDFRVAVGTTALQGKFKLAGKDAGSEIMEVLFGERNKQLYDSVVILSQALGITLRDYTITAMLNIADELEERRKAGDIKSLLEKSGCEPAEFRQAEKFLNDFLMEGAGANIREQLLLRQEVARGEIFEEAERAMTKPKTAEELKLEIRSEKEIIDNLWKKLKSGSFEQAPLTARRIIHSRELADELERELKDIKRGKETAIKQLSPEEEVACRWVMALKRSAHQFRLDAEEENLTPEEVKKLQRRAAKYKSDADGLLAGLQTPAEEAAK